MKKVFFFLKIVEEILRFLPTFSAYFCWNTPEDSLSLTSCHAEEVISALAPPSGI